ncbi:hypothetical protein, partial [Martelella alba]
RIRAVIRRNGTSLSMSFNGLAIASATLSAAMPVLSVSRFGALIAGSGSTLDLRINEFGLWPDVMSDSELVARGTINA